MKLSGHEGSGERCVSRALRVAALPVAMVLLPWVLQTQAQQAQSEGSGAADEPPPAAVEVVTVRSDAATEELRVVGSLLAGESVVMRPEVDGRIATIEFQEGEPAGAGQVLFTLDPAEYHAQVASSEAATKLWELKFERARDLHSRNVVSQQEYDEAQEALKVARARLALERVRLDKTIIRAPFAGIVGLRRVSPGDYVEAGQALVNLEAVDPVKVDFSIPERYAAEIRTGQPFTLTVAPFPDRSFGGEVYAIDPRLDEAARTVRLRGRLPNTDGALKPGMFSRVTLTLEVRGRALWIPEEALVPRGDGQFVYRIENGKAMLTPVTIGLRRTGVVEIRSGLSAGDLIVTAGQFRLRDGAAVRIVDAPPQVTSALSQ